MKISTIIDKIDNKGMFVPAFQRQYVWKRENAKALINSLLRNFPAGTILTWDTMNPPELKRASYRPEMGAVKLILDGQQRVTTLYMLIKGEIPPYYIEKEIENDIRGLYYNLKTTELEYYAPSKMSNDPFWVDITKAFTSDISAVDIVDEYERITATKLESQEYKDLLKAIQSNLTKLQSIKDREFPELEVPSTADIIQAIDIFDIVNSSGIKLSEAELALAQISGKWPTAREVFNNKIFQLKDLGYEFDLDFIVQLLQAVIHHSGSEMKRLHKDSAESIQTAWNALDKHVIDYGLSLLKNRANLDSTAEVNSYYNLIPFFTYIYDQPNHLLNEDQINKAINWLLLSLLWNRYVTQGLQRLDADLKAIASESEPFTTLKDRILEDRGRFELKAEDLVGRTVQHPAYSLMIMAAKDNDAICFGSGLPLKNNLGEKYKIESDHIFPYAKLRDMGYHQGNHLKYKLAQELSNRALITQKINRSKSDSDPAVFLENVETQFPNALKKQFVPMNKELWSLDRYEEFLGQRRKIIAEAINDFIAGFLQSAEERKNEINIAQLIATGESSSLEFKTSFRWDVREHNVNKALEKVVIKTLAGFMNSDGGTLIIGVEDNGYVYGLESDFGTLEKNNADGFENHFSQIFNKMIGVDFRQYVSLNFQTIEDKVVCCVQVLPSDRPVYVEEEGKQEFFVRTGNATSPMLMGQAFSYIESRWKK